MCPGCWRLVSLPVQTSVYATVGLRGTRVDATWAPWWRAQSAAMAEVAAHRGADPAAIAAMLLKDNTFADLLERRGEL